MRVSEFEKTSPERLFKRAADYTKRTIVLI